MKEMLSDLIAAHKSLCAAYAQSQGAGEAVSHGVAAPPRVPQVDQQFLSDDEESQLEEAMGLQPNPLMDQLVARQFQELLKQRETPEPSIAFSDDQATTLKNLKAADVSAEPLPIRPVSAPNGKAVLNPRSILDDFNMFESLSGG